MIGSKIPRSIENPTTHQLFGTFLEAWQFCRHANLPLDVIERINWKNWGISRTWVEAK